MSYYVAKFSSHWEDWERHSVDLDTLEEAEQWYNMWKYSAPQVADGRWAIIHVIEQTNGYKHITK
jgi:hypothetical protein